MMRWAWQLGLSVLCVIAVGCASMPASVTRWHSLRMPTPLPLAAQSASAGWTLAPVQLATHLDTPQIVRRRLDGAWTMLEHERWVSALADEVHAALSEQLAHRLGPQRSDGVRIVVNVQRLDAGAGGDTLLVAEWRLGGAGSPLACRSQLQRSAGASVDAIVAAQRELLAGLTEQWARTLPAFVAGRAACPP